MLMSGATTQTACVVRLTECLPDFKSHSFIKITGVQKRHSTLLLAVSANSLLCMWNESSHWLVSQYNVVGKNPFVKSVIHRRRAGSPVVLFVRTYSPRRCQDNAPPLIPPVNSFPSLSQCIMCNGRGVTPQCLLHVHVSAHPSRSTDLSVPVDESGRAKCVQMEKRRGEEIMYEPYG